MHARTQVIDIRPYLAKRKRMQQMLDKERRRLERDQAIIDRAYRRPRPVRGPGGAA